jgi:hypothetical protein
VAKKKKPHRHRLPLLPLLRPPLLLRHRRLLLLTLPSRLMPRLRLLPHPLLTLPSRPTLRLRLPLPRRSNLLPNTAVVRC